MALMSGAIRSYDDSGMCQVRYSVSSGRTKPRVTWRVGIERLAGGRDRRTGPAGGQGVAGPRRDHLNPRGGRVRRPSPFA